MKVKNGADFFLASRWHYQQPPVMPPLPVPQEAGGG